MIRCLHCGAETSNGLALCDLCQKAAQMIFEYLPVYFRNLARWRPGRAGSREVPGSRVLYDGGIRGDGSGDRISDKLDEAMNALTTWARALVKDRPHFPHPLTFADAVLTGDLPDALVDELTDNQPAVAEALCIGFELHLTSIATLDWCGEFVRDLSQHEVTLRGLTETYIPGWYAGECRRCKTKTYVLPGFTWVTCQGCGAVTYARDHLEVILEEARDWLARPKALAEAIVALVDTEMSVPRLYERIHKWGTREPRRITAIRQTQRTHVYDLAEDAIVVKNQEVGSAKYRLGEVLDVILSEGRTRTRTRRAANA